MKITAVFLWLLLVDTLGAQDYVTGLSRIYIRPMDGHLEHLLTTEIVQERLPVVITDSVQSADCVLGLVSAEQQQLVLVDSHNRSVVWVFPFRKKEAQSLVPAKERKLALHVVHKMISDGVYCGGASFNAPSQSAADRVKAFKPPTFNW